MLTNEGKKRKILGGNVEQKRELERQIDSSLFERLALSRDKKGVL